MIIIGITGTLGAGKGTIVEYLVEHRNFRHYSFRDFIIEEVERRNRPVNRDTMTETANTLRQEYGPFYIAEALCKRAEANGANAIIESIRNPGEVEFLKTKANFYLFAVDADPKIRYERIKLRASVTDAITFEKFLADEAREMESTDPWHQNIRRCIERADYFFRNDAGRGDLHRAIEDILPKIGFVG